MRSKNHPRVFPFHLALYPSWLGMMAVEPQDDGTLHVRCYAQVIATPRDGQPRLHAMCVCDDVLVRVDGELLVRRRQVSRDDQA